jgi:hypothetical protein
MIQMFKYIFSRIYLFYQNVLHVRRRTHFYTAFVLSLLVFANIFVIVNTFTFLLFDRMALGITSSYFIYIGNAVMFFMLIVVSISRKYVTVLKEIQLLQTSDKKKLTMISNVYVAISLVSLLPFIFGMV